VVISFRVTNYKSFSRRWPNNIGSLAFLVRVTLDVFAWKWFCHVSVGWEHHRFVKLDLKVDHNITVVSHYCNILVAHQGPIQLGILQITRNFKKVLLYGFETFCLRSFLTLE
jgi:hypothetical protein